MLVMSDETHRIGPRDPRYGDLLRRGFNKRFTGEPDYVRLVASADDVVRAVQDAVREGRHLAARSGGHCLENFVANPEVRVVIDTSLMTGVSYDTEKNAFEVLAGTTLGELARRLFLGWGVVLPAGESPAVGVGGHILGGAFGFLCRQHGLAADHLYGVEVVVVDESGTARRVVAMRQADDPHRDLWWAHTGGGGGNFGIVTRYWLRSPGTHGDDPTLMLPLAPESVHSLRVSWNWSDVSEAAFTRMVQNHGRWCTWNAFHGTPSSLLHTTFFLHRRQRGVIELKGVSTAGDMSERLFDEHLAAINEGAGVPFTRTLEKSSWLGFALNPFPELFGVGMDVARVKVKDAYLRRPLTDAQIAVAYRYLTSTDHDVPGGTFALGTYGGRVNTVRPAETATAQRDSILSIGCVAGWGDPKDEAPSFAWVRPFYRDLFGDTGGVPVPDDNSDGAMINHPDVDLADPAWNTSGVPWHTLYYKDNYPRLQQVKARYDPRNVFHHALSIRLPD
jgi:aclacinomycin oxidase